MVVVVCVCVNIVSSRQSLPDAGFFLYNSLSGPWQTDMSHIRQLTSSDGPPPQTKVGAMTMCKAREADGADPGSRVYAASNRQPRQEPIFAPVTN